MKQTTTPSCQATTRLEKGMDIKNYNLLAANVIHN